MRYINLRLTYLLTIPPAEPGGLALDQIHWLLSVNSDIEPWFHIAACYTIRSTGNSNSTSKLCHQCTLI